MKWIDIQYGKLQMLEAKISIWFWSKFHPCRVSYSEYDHDYTFIDDSFDYEGPFGLSTHSCGHWECEICGYIPEKQWEPPTYDFDWPEPPKE